MFCVISDTLKNISRGGIFIYPLYYYHFDSLKKIDPYSSYRCLNGGNDYSLRRGVYKISSYKLYNLFRRNNIAYRFL